MEKENQQQKAPKDKHASEKCPKCGHRYTTGKKSKHRKCSNKSNCIDGRFLCVSCVAEKFDIYKKEKEVSEEHTANVAETLEVVAIENEVPSDICEGINTIKPRNVEIFQPKTGPRRKPIELLKNRFKRLKPLKEKMKRMTNELMEALRKETPNAVNVKIDIFVNDEKVATNVDYERKTERSLKRKSTASPEAWFVILIFFLKQFHKTVTKIQCQNVQERKTVPGRLRRNCQRPRFELEMQNCFENEN